MRRETNIRSAISRLVSASATRPTTRSSVGVRLSHPNEGGAGAAGASDAEGAQRRVDTGDVPNGTKTVVDGDRLVQEGDRFVRSGGAPEGNPGVLAGRR